LAGHLPVRILAISKAQAKLPYRLDTVRASNVENRQKTPGPDGWVENGLAAALRLAFSLHRGDARSPRLADSPF